MSDLKAKPGQPVTASKWNAVVDRLPANRFGDRGNGSVRLRLCRVVATIDAAVIDATDTADSVYSSGEVQTYGLINNGDDTFSPGLTSQSMIMINASTDNIPAGTELWAIESWDGVLVSTVWIC